MENTIMGMTGRSLCNIKSGNLQFCCIYSWCLSQKAHKHFLPLFSFFPIWKHEAVINTWNLATIPVCLMRALWMAWRTSPRRSIRQSVQGLHDKILLLLFCFVFVTLISVHLEATDQPRQVQPQICQSKYRYVPCQRGTAFFTKHRGVSPHPSVVVVETQC